MDHNRVDQGFRRLGLVFARLNIARRQRHYGGGTPSNEYRLVYVFICHVLCF